MPHTLIKTFAAATSPIDIMMSAKVTGPGFKSAGFVATKLDAAEPVWATTWLSPRMTHSTKTKNKKMAAAPSALRLPKMILTRRGEGLPMGSPSSVDMAW